MTDAPIAIVENYEECKTSAERYLAYLKKQEGFPTYPAPEVVIICYQKSALECLLENQKYEQGKSFLTKLYMLDGGKVGIMGGFGCGAPALSIKMEELIVWGVKKFISVGTAGSLSEEFPIGTMTIGTKALCGEDGVSQLYMTEGGLFAESCRDLFGMWEEFVKKEEQTFHPVSAWTFSNPYRETHKDILRVKDLGCHVVEMEAATLYAMSKEKGVQALALFVISDALHGDIWEPRFKDPVVKENLQQLARLALQFSENL